MALLGMCFNLMQDKVVHKVRNCGRKIGCIRDSDEFDENFDDGLMNLSWYEKMNLKCNFINLKLNEEKFQWKYRWN